MIRVFVGVRIDPSVVERIGEAQTELKRKLPGVRWVERENLHFTVKFLGLIDEAKSDPITQALKRVVEPFSRFSILARGIGVFPDIRRARILWVGLNGGRLASLASAVETALEPMGFAPEKRQFQPHLTIGRWRNFDGRAAGLLSGEIERWKEYDFGETAVGEIIFFQSILKTQGALYNPLQVMRLSN